MNQKTEFKAMPQPAAQPAGVKIKFSGPEELPLIRDLLEIARKAHAIIHDMTFGQPGSHPTVSHGAACDLADALASLEALPQPEGQALTGPARAEQALFGIGSAPAADDQDDVSLMQPRTAISDGEINEITTDKLGQWPSFEAQSWACKVVHAVDAHRGEKRFPVQVLTFSKGKNAPTPVVIDLNEASVKAIHDAYVKRYGPLDPNIMMNDIIYEVCEMIAVYQKPDTPAADAPRNIIVFDSYDAEGRRAIHGVRSSFDVNGDMRLMESFLELEQAKRLRSVPFKEHKLGALWLVDDAHLQDMKRGLKTDIPWGMDHVSPNDDVAIYSVQYVEKLEATVLNRDNLESLAMKALAEGVDVGSIYALYGADSADTVPDDRVVDACIYLRGAMFAAMGEKIKQLDSDAKRLRGLMALSHQIGSLAEQPWALYAGQALDDICKDQADAKRLRGLLEMAGYDEGGDKSTLTIWHDDATDNVGIAIGSPGMTTRRFNGSIPRAAMDAVLAALERDKATAPAIPSAPLGQHDCYKDGDADIPEQICDSNGQVVLGQCKRCGLVEIELVEQPVCKAKPSELYK